MADTPKTAPHACGWTPMKKAVLKFVWIYMLYVVVFLLMKPVFMLVYRTTINCSLWDAVKVLYHGSAMDFSVAGYLSVIPGLLIAGELLSSRRWLRVALNIYMGVTFAIVGTIYCLDMGLYGSWGFRLDMTPVFYITTSPAAAMASVQWWQWFAGAIGIACICCGMWLLYRFTAGVIHVMPPATGKGRVWFPAAMVVVTALLIIPIRGSFTVSTMNLSRAYFSTNPRLNHAAINPLFSLLYSATHQSNFNGEYKYMPDDEAETVVMALLKPKAPETGALANDSIAPSVISADSLRLLSTDRPDVVLVILESFSSHLMPSLGGEPVAVGLDSIGREGVMFTNMYANSFRTDRALASILGSFPSAPNTSLLKYVEKFDNLPSFPRLMKAEGYDLTYYYGGDANFTNMKAFLISMGFDPIISDGDFPAADRMSKWGAHDDKLFTKALERMSLEASGPRRGVPRLSVIQTSSSHEPFEVPYANSRFASSPRLNAFAYTDSCLTDFVNRLSRMPGWDRTLVVIVPDHYGCWPEQVDDPLMRHKIPVVMTGGALRRRGVGIDRIAMQTDLGATLLGMLGISHAPLKYSRDILGENVPQVAIFTEPQLVGIVTPTDTILVNPDAGGSMPTAAGAYLRDVYATMGGL